MLHWTNTALFAMQATTRGWAPKSGRPRQQLLNELLSTIIGSNTTDQPGTDRIQLTDR